MFKFKTVFLPNCIESKVVSIVNTQNLHKFRICPTFFNNNFPMGYDRYSPKLFNKKLKR
uniref:Uncharacterized protein n=1 Tax=Nelumbo nucifera TaxID=4432 RepID=A0A822YTE6_NELNU|nr:TPA_asm: hypothetical protein HUJ06_008035 [Nelumbo nucifera]